MIPIDFEALFAKSPNPYLLVDEALTIVWMNEAYLASTMRERAGILGRNMFDAFPADPESESYQLLRGSFDRVLRTGETDEIALIRYDIEKPDGSMEVRYWSATHTPLPGPKGIRVENGGGAAGTQGNASYILQHTVDVTELQGLRRLRDEMGVVQRATAIQERSRQANEEARRLRNLVEQAPGFVAVLTEPEHVFRLANQAYRTLVGNRDVIGKSVCEVLPEVVEQGFIALLDTVRESGEPYKARGARVLLRDEQGRARERYLDFIYQPIFASDGSGTVSGIFVQGYDVTEQFEAQERQRLLINELNHRVKNTLAIVQSLATQSFRHVASADLARHTFQARLNALAAAHSLLTLSNWKLARLSDTLQAPLAATAGEAMARITVRVPEFTLQPQIAVSLAMIVHELATNAIKYGALSNESGRVEVECTVEEEDGHCRLRIEWVERGGPVVEPPTRRGFGTRLIERGMSAERQSAVQLRFEPAGLRCSISALLPAGLA